MDTDYTRRLTDRIDQCCSLDELVAYLQDELRMLRERLRLEKAGQAEDLWGRNNRKTVEEFKLALECFRLQYVKCGKKDCPCRSGRGHGPYWYAFWAAKGRTRSRYIGKELPEHAKAARRAALEEREAKGHPMLATALKSPVAQADELADTQVMLDEKIFGQGPG